uniref:START domain-containing protein n=1 Tax=Steinernema glaseri TaxID=37863 RepID=A0A1I7ZKD5_9BILA
MDNPHTPLIYDEHAMSKDRRRFLVFSVFDSAIAVVLWILCLVSRTTGGLWDKFINEINILQPDFFEQSAFDVVIAALIRTSVMLLLYGVIRISIWAPVLFTTSATTIYTGFKALLYFNHDHNGFQQYLLILLPFTIAWVELFMMPCQVLAHERRAARDVDGYDVETGHTRHSRASVSRGGGRTSVVAVRNLLTTDDEFRSAMEYSSGESDHEGDRRRISAGGSGIISKNVYIDAVAKAEVEGERMLTDVETWRIVSKADPLIRYHDSSRTYYVREEFETNTRKLFTAAWNDNHQWNRQITKFTVILTIDLKTEVIHTISAPAMRGYISSRDFVDVRRVQVDEDKDVFQGTYVSVESPIQPPDIRKKIVRGENGVNLVRVSPSRREGFAVYEWLMNSDVKGGIPRRLIERTMASFLISYVKALREFLEAKETSSTTSPAGAESPSSVTN